MTSNPSDTDVVVTRRVFNILAVLVAVGVLSFGICALSGDPGRAWQAYLLNFLVFSAISQGALLFSVIMHTVRAKWSGPLASLAESFTAFFPVSFILFLILFLGRGYVFPWLHEDLHGKEVWLNIPFLFSRDIVGLLVLYGTGLAYLYHALPPKLTRFNSEGGLRTWLFRMWDKRPLDEARRRSRQTVFGIIYMLAFALVLSLLGYDLVMSMDPHWYSTLFGAYSFVKAIYIGFGALIILAAVLHVTPGIRFSLLSSQFHDMGKLFFAFCLVWADFFYAQFVVIWYGNIPEETAYIIERTYHAPWKYLAWAVFVVCFVMPFIILLNKKIKTMPKAMTLICSIVIIGIWFEHFLVLGPVFHHGATLLPLSIWDGLITLGFVGLIALSVGMFLNHFPELYLRRETGEVG